MASHRYRANQSHSGYSRQYGNFRTRNPEPGPKYKPNTPRNYCNLCKSNREVPEVYKGHRLRDDAGRTTCPILRAHKCPECGGTGDNGHTLKYCPKVLSRASGSGGSPSNGSETNVSEPGTKASDEPQDSEQGGHAEGTQEKAGGAQGQPPREPEVAAATRVENPRLYHTVLTSTGRPRLLKY